MDMTLQEAIPYIRENLSCLEYLDKSKGGLFSCRKCGSGTHGATSTGAVKYYPDSNTWFCHACKASGDALDLIQLKEDVDFMGAVRIAADRLGITIANTSAQKATRTRETKKGGNPTSETTKRDTGENTGHDGQNLKDYTEYYQQCEKNLYDADDPAAALPAIGYMLSRGISDTTYQRLHIGFDPASTMLSDKYPEPRIIIPINGFSFIGRSILPDSQYAKRWVKGCSGHTDMFNRAALDSDAGAIFVVEGAFDAMSLEEIGCSAIALNSYSNSKFLLSYLTEHDFREGRGFIISFDNDENITTAANVREAERALKLQLEAKGYKALIRNIAGDYHDINDRLKTDRAQLEADARDAIDNLDGDEITEFFDTIQTAAFKPHKTGLNFFDDLIGGGLEQHTLTIIMAAPGAGKTTLCAQLAETMALNRKPMIYLNLEMSGDQMRGKAFSFHLARQGNAYLSTKEIMRGYAWTPRQRKAIEAERDRYRRESLPYIKYNPQNVGNNIEDISEYLTKVGNQAKAQGKEAPGVVLDYLHLVGSDPGKAKAKLEGAELIKKVVMELKSYATTFDTFVIAISAVGREALKSGSISLFSGRDSSNIEYTGDYVLSLTKWSENTHDDDNDDSDDIDADAIDPEFENAMREYKTYSRVKLKLLKARFEKAGRYKKLWFDSTHNIFYGSGDLLPVGLDDRLSNEPKQIKQNVIKI